MTFFGDLFRRLFGQPETPKPIAKPVKSPKLLKTSKNVDEFELVTRQLKELKGKEKLFSSGGKGPRILFATGLGAYNHGSVLDSVLAMATQLRGAQSKLLLCDSFLPICQIIKQSGTPIEVFEKRQTPPRCPACFKRGNELMQQTGLPVLRYSDFVSSEERSAIEQEVAALSSTELATYAPHGLPAGEHALAGALRFFARGDLAEEPDSEIVLRRSLEAALLTIRAIENILDRDPVDIVVAHHGIYVPQGLLVAVCAQRKVRVVTWNPAYRKHSFIFSHDDSYHHTMIHEPTSVWKDMPWNAALEADLAKYLKSRWYGTEDWIWFHSEPEHDVKKIQEEVGWDPSKPVVTLLSNVVWDAQLHYASNAFSGMIEWVIETIRYFAKRPELQLVIRIHPAEIRGFVPSRQPLHKEIEKAFAQLPGNVFVVLPQSDVSTYALCDASNAVLIYNTKTGMEVTAQGIPTIVAGEAWIRNKGFAESPTTREQYFGLLDALPLTGRMTAEQIEQARRYAYHVFFRRMVPLPFLEPQGSTALKLAIDSVDQLLPGAFPGLDVICDGILRGTPFVYPAERLRQEKTHALREGHGIQATSVADRPRSPEPRV